MMTNLIHILLCKCMVSVNDNWSYSKYMELPLWLVGGLLPIMRACVPAHMHLTFSQEAIISSLSDIFPAKSLSTTMMAVFTVFHQFQALPRCLPCFRHSLLRCLVTTLYTTRVWLKHRRPRIASCHFALFVLLRRHKKLTCLWGAFSSSLSIAGGVGQSKSARHGNKTFQPVEDTFLFVVTHDVFERLVDSSDGAEETYQYDNLQQQWESLNKHINSSMHLYSTWSQLNIPGYWNCAKMSI